MNRNRPYDIEDWLLLILAFGIWPAFFIVLPLILMLMGKI